MSSRAKSRDLRIIVRAKHRISAKIPPRAALGRNDKLSYLNGIGKNFGGVIASAARQCYNVLYYNI